jgi:hypothetical protein
MKGLVVPPLPPPTARKKAAAAAAIVMENFSFYTHFQQYFLWGRMNIKVI